MPDLIRPTRQVLGEVVTDLVRRHGGPTRVGDAVGADRTTVHRWMRGEIGLEQLGALAENLIEPVVVRLGPDTTKEAAPSLTRRLLAGVMALEKRAKISPEELESAELSAAETERLALEADALLVQRVAQTQRKRSARVGGRAGVRLGGSPSSKRRSQK